MVKSVNRYIFRHCPKYHPEAQAAAAPAKPAAAKPSSKAGEPAPAPAAKKQGG